MKEIEYKGFEGEIKQDDEGKMWLIVAKKGNVIVHAQSKSYNRCISDFHKRVEFYISMMQDE